MKTIKCSNCGRKFDCGHPGSCWCARLPQIMSVEADNGCLCHDCLLDLQNKKIKQFIEKTPLPQIIAEASKYNNDELLEGLDYVVQKGQWIFSKWYHLKRGFCCEKGCVNCPY